MPTIAEIQAMPPGGDRTRAMRRLQIFWAILYKGGFPADEPMLSGALAPIRSGASVFDPCFAQDLRDRIYKQDPNGTPNSPGSPDELCKEFTNLIEVYETAHNDPAFISSSGKPLLEADELNLPSVDNLYALG